MATLYTQQSSNIRKTWLLMSVFLVVVVALGWIFSRAYGDPGILYFAVGFSFIMNFFSYWYSDKIALAMNGAKEVTHENAKEIYHIVENLCITAGIKTPPKVYIIDEPAPNAFATGRNIEHAAIALTTGILEKLDRSELEGVIAHELSHIGNRDILISTVAVVLAGFIAILSDWFLRSRMLGFGGGRDRDNNGSNGIFVILAIVAAILAPLAATLIRLAVSRKREFLADASGALLTRYPEGLASALEKISSYSTPMRKANNATAHLFIASPFGGKAGRGLAGLFMTHPPIEDRIKNLRGMEVKS